jgi:hypothetical protein
VVVVAAVAAAAVAPAAVTKAPSSNQLIYGWHFSV